MSATLQAVQSIRFVANIGTDADVPNAARQMYQSSNGAFSAGFWSSEAARHDIQYTMDELCFILEGQVRLTDANGHVESYGAGDVFLIPAGFTGVWETVEPTKKFYAIHKTCA
jgi:hypothetical protein